MYRRSKRPAVVIAAAVFLAIVALFGSRVFRPSGPDPDAIPRRVMSADDLARRAVPGWNRAEAQGLVVPVDVAATIPDTSATVTFERAWYSGRQAYMTYTVRAPENEHVMPTRVLLLTQSDPPSAVEGWTDFLHLKQWGGFSEDGFHGVLVFDRLPEPPLGARLTMEVRQWAPVYARTGLEQGPGKGLPVTLQIPWDEAYLTAPAPAVYPLNLQGAWLGRSLALDQLRVGIGRIDLTGTLQLPPSESNPGLGCRLKLGKSTRDLKEFKAVAGSAPGTYEFIASFDGPDTWPAAASLELSSIRFQSDRTLEWRFPWATKKALPAHEAGTTLSRADQASVEFYDSILRTVAVWDGGVAVELQNIDGPAPRVWAALGGGGRRDESGPGMEITTPDGRVVRNLGGGGGVVWSIGGGARDIQGVSANWWDAVPPEFEGADYLTLRYVHPGAFMVLDEKWDLPLARTD